MGEGSPSAVSGAPTRQQHRGRRRCKGGANHGTAGWEQSGGCSAPAELWLRLRPRCSPWGGSEGPVALELRVHWSPGWCSLGCGHAALVASQTRENRVWLLTAPIYLSVMCEQIPLSIPKGTNLRMIKMVSGTSSLFSCILCFCSSWLVKASVPGSSFVLCNHRKLGVKSGTVLKQQTSLCCAVME